AIVGVGVIVLLVPSDRRPRATDPKLTWQAVAGIGRVPRFPALGIVPPPPGLATISDPFVSPRAQHPPPFHLPHLPPLYRGTATAYMLLAIPMGGLADRIGREKVFVGGYVLLLGVYALLLTAGSGFAIALLLVLFGAYYAATDGVLAAAATAILPEHVRGSG